MSPSVLEVASSPKIGRFGRTAYDIAFSDIAHDPRITILEGAVRSGKTWALNTKILGLCTYPVGGIRLLTGVSKETIFTNVLNDLFDVIGTDSYRYNRVTGDLELFGTWWKVIGAKDEGSEKYIRGATVGACVGDELTKQPESFFVMLMNRLSPPGARFYGSTNPDSPFHWLLRNWINNQALRDAGDLRSIHFDLDDNPHLTATYKGFLKRAYTGVYYQRFVEGKWVVAEGAIYRDCWTDDLVFDDSTFPNHARNEYADRFIACDYGTSHKQVYLDIFDDGSDLWVTREYIWDSVAQMRQKTDSEYADDLEQFLNVPQYGLRAAAGCLVIVPPEAASFQAELVQRGLWLRDAANEVGDGIRFVSTLMGVKKLHVHRRCENLLQEITTYAWDMKKAEHGIEEPIKQHDDCVDALRYGIKTKVPAWRIAT